MPRRPRQRVRQPSRRKDQRRNDVMRITFVAQFFQNREGQRAIAIEPPVETLRLLGDNPNRALDIGRGLLEPVVEKTFLERLLRPPDARDTAILRMEGAKMHRGAIERYAGLGNAFAKAGEELGIIGCEPGFAQEPVIDVPNAIRRPYGRGRRGVLAPPHCARNIRRIVHHLLAPVGKLLGYDVIIVDPRTAFATDERFPDVKVIAQWPDEALPPLGVDHYTAFVALTQTIRRHFYSQGSLDA